MSVPWEGIALVLGAVGTVIAGILTYRQASQKDRQEDELSRQRSLLEREQALINRYENQLANAHARIDELEAERRVCEQHILEIERQMGALQRQVDKLMGNGGAKP